jgi:hypothetical protein
VEGVKPVKKLIVINGAMGVGKSVICKELNKRLVNSVWLDGDWCMMMNPWNFSKPNTMMFLDNIHHLLNNFLSNPTFEYVLLSWVFPREDMENYTLQQLSNHEFELKKVTLMCADDKLKERMLAGGRDDYTIEKSLAYQQAFADFSTVKLDTTELSIDKTLDKVLEIIEG